MSDLYETRISGRTPIERAHFKGQIKGWVQGGGIVLAVMMLLKFLGWIPVILIAGVLGFFGFKLFKKFGGSKSE